MFKERRGKQQIQAEDVQCGCDGFERTSCAKSSKSYHVLPHGVRKRKASVCCTTSHNLMFMQWMLLSLVEGHFNQLASIVWIMWPQDLAHDSTPIAVRTLPWHTSVPPLTLHQNQRLPDQSETPASLVPCEAPQCPQGQNMGVCGVDKVTGQHHF